MTTKAKVSVENFELLKAQFLLDVKVAIEFDDIPPELVINWDQTGIHYVPVSSWTMENEGSKWVEIAGADDKQQITAVFGGSIAGDFLPVQLIYQGKTTRSLPSHKFPSSWHVTFTENHWSSELTTTSRNFLFHSYIEKKRS